MKTAIGILLLVLAAGNIVYDGAHSDLNMGAGAILLTCVAASAGCLLVRRGRRGQPT
jgi:hypothetical protein